MNNSNRANLQRSNSYYPESVIEPNLQLLHAKKVDSSIRLSMHVLNQYTLINGDSLELVDDTFRTVWKTNRFSEGYVVFCDEESVFVLEANKLQCLDLTTSEAIWSQELPPATDLYNVMHCDEKFVYVSTINSKETEFYAYDRSTGDQQWSLKTPDIGFAYLQCIDNLLYIKRLALGNEILCFDRSTLKLRATFNVETLAKSISFGNVSPQFDLTGPCIGGVKYIATSDGYVCAYDILNESVLWHHKILIPKWFTGYNTVSAQNIIIKDDEVYFNVYQGTHGNKNFLTVLDRSSGESVFQSQLAYGDKGFDYPLMAGDFFIGGKDSQLIFFDTESKEFVYKYNYEQNILSLFNSFLISNNRIVTSCAESNTVFWFGNS